MKVILIQDVKALGKKGEIVEINDGYARNFVLPKKLGIEATPKNMNDLKLQKQNDAKVAAENLAEAKAMAETLSKLTVNTKVKVGEGGKTFGSVSSKEISDELAKQHNIKIDKKKIVLKDAIKAVGSYTVSVKLHPEVTGELKVKVEGM
ncbi:MAG: 50S ribosomal protein L9 [Eubacterium sp.]|nr:50S ribosomal protein L9 [Eubacterium sp.]MBQ7425029.1 50S ribosomal protein L9 [Lachnospiraceae bacterium]MBR1673695.1 50S ribosomal protein L9 [Eubacterium sp.]